jgi:FkbM family methyltransferase
MSIESITRQIFWRLGLDVKRKHLPGSSVGLMLNLVDFSEADLALDVGANEGQFAKELLRYRPKMPVVSFEPGSQAHHLLQLSARHFPTWTVAKRVALGAEPSVATLNLTQNSQCASLRKVADGGPTLGNFFEAAGVEKTTVERLDQFESSEIDRAKRIYLKIDVQGFEKEVFQGCKQLLPRIAAIQVELSLMEVYEGQEFGLSSLAQFMDAGFVLYGISNGWRDNETGHLIQLDAFLLNSACRPCSTVRQA